MISENVHFCQGTITSIYIGLTVIMVIRSIVKDLEIFSFSSLADLHLKKKKCQPN